MLVAHLGSDEFQIVRFDGKHFELICARAFAPGYPLVLTVALDGSPQLDLKCTGSKKRTDGKFDVRARITTMPKSVREKLLAALAV